MTSTNTFPDSTVPEGGSYFGSTCSNPWEFLPRGQPEVQPEAEPEPHWTTRFLKSAAKISISAVAACASSMLFDWIFPQRATIAGNEVTNVSKNAFLPKNEYWIYLRNVLRVN